MHFNNICMGPKEVLPKLLGYILFLNALYFHYLIFELSYGQSSNVQLFALLFRQF